MPAFTRKNMVPKHLRWNDTERRFLLDNHKTMPLGELAAALNKTEKQIINQCSRQQCSYFS